MPAGQKGWTVNLIKQLLMFLATIVRTLLYQWIVKLIELFRMLIAVIRRYCARARLPVRLRRSAPQRCVKISDPAYKRPDPLIYDQYYLMKQGMSVTWDNPDINLYQGGVLVPSHKLQADTDYEIVARIWNNSTEAPVLGLPVHFSYLSFGVGTQSHLIGDTAVDLGVKGGPNHPAFAHMKWHTPPTAGHYCIQVLLTWTDDANPNNNLGQENTNVGTLHSPAQFDFQLRNDTRERQAYRFEADAYVIPPLDPCQQRPANREPPREPLRAAPGTIAVVPPKHAFGNQPLPPGWTVSFSPAAPLIDPGQEITVKVVVNAPAGFKGRQPVNVHAFNRYGMAGGVTLYVESA